MNVAVVGLGKIGLPLAVQFAGAGATVVGVDRRLGLLVDIEAGRSPYPHETDLGDKMRNAVDAGRLMVTEATEEAAGTAEVVVVVVPVGLDADNRAAFADLDDAIRRIGAGLRQGTLVIIESTVPVGTTRHRCGPLLEEASGLVAGEGFLLAHSPERVMSGRIFTDLRTYPKLVGGVNTRSGSAAAVFYTEMLSFTERPDLPAPNGVWDLGSAEAAELAKLAETVYRDVNIALANEFATFATRHDIALGPVIDAANSQPFSHVHRPGVAVGGHCIPVYPHLYLEGHPDSLLPALARQINHRGPQRALDTVAAALGGLDGVTVLILGVAYRGGVKETARSGVFPLAAGIERMGGTAVVSDPLYSDAELAELGLTPLTVEEPTVAIVQADHAAYATLGAADLPSVRIVYDGRAIIDPGLWSGCEVYGVEGPRTASPGA